MLWFLVNHMDNFTIWLYL